MHYNRYNRNKTYLNVFVHDKSKKIWKDIKRRRKNISGNAVTQRCKHTFLFSDW